VGTDPDGQGLVRIPAHGLEVTAEEAGALGARFDEVLGEGELTLHAVHPRRWYLDGTPGWRGAAGPVPAGERCGEPGLLRLVSETEMLFFDHDVNRRRAETAAPLVGGIHAWGGGLLPARGPGQVPAGWGGEPYLAGLWRLAGRAVESGPEPLFEAGGVAWPVPAEESGPGLPARLEDELAPGALRALSRGRVREVRLITDDAIIVTTRLGAVLPWRRPRPLAELI
jgi:hypothetical protein